MEKEIIKVTVVDDIPDKTGVRIMIDSDDEPLLFSALAGCIDLFSKRTGITQENILKTLMAISKDYLNIFEEEKGNENLQEE